MTPEMEEEEPRQITADYVQMGMAGGRRAREGMVREVRKLAEISESHIS